MGRQLGRTPRVPNVAGIRADAGQAAARRDHLEARHARVAQRADLTAGRPGDHAAGDIDLMRKEGLRFLVLEIEPLPGMAIALPPAVTCWEGFVFMDPMRRSGHIWEMQPGRKRHA